MVARQQNIQKLADHFHVEYKLAEIDRLCEQNTFLPSIGAEIEVHWRSVIPQYHSWFDQGGYSSLSDEKKERFQLLCHKLEREKKPLYMKTMDFGINSGNDGFYEFAFSPVRWYKSASEEIRILYDANLINSSFENPLHITVEGLKNNIQTGLLVCAVELLGATSYERLLKACQPGITRQTWDKKGKSGIVKKRKTILDNAVNSGIEIRTLVAKSPSQIEETMKNIQLLSWGMLSEHHSTQYMQWESVRKIVSNEILTPYGLNKWWKRPQQSNKEWKLFATLLENPEFDSVKHEIRDTITRLDDLVREKTKCANKSSL